MSIIMSSSPDSSSDRMHNSPSDPSAESEISWPRWSRRVSDFPVLHPSGRLLPLLMPGSAVLVWFVTPAAAQIRDFYCGTPVETGLTLLGTALLGLGLPVTIFFLARSGLSYLRSQGQPDQQNVARRDLVLSLTGFTIIVLAIVAPGIVSKIGSTMGFSFSSCVNPFA